MSNNPTKFRTRVPQVGGHAATPATVAARTTPKRTSAADSAVELAKFRGESASWREEILHLTATETEIDPRVQRPEQLAWQQWIADPENFEPMALNTLIASARWDEGLKKYRFFLLDGQQRRGACILAGYTKPLTVKVHYDLTLAEEARLFILSNRRKVVTPLDQFGPEILAGNPVALAIKRVLDQLSVPLGANKKGFAGIVAARKIIRRPDGDGEVHFAWALKTLQELYLKQADNDNIYDAVLVEGLARFHEEYAALPQFDMTRFLKNVYRGLPSPERMRGAAKSSSTVNRVSMPSGVVQQLVRFYNVGLGEESRNRISDYNRKR